jgi:alpha-beta hydrolase superfamily lysophospholipase
MRYLEDSFVSSSGIRLFYQVWCPDKAPKAVIQLIHGILEHSGRYLNLVNELVKRDFVVYAADHQGHGRSEGVRAYVKSFDVFIEDQKIFYDLIREKEQDIPIFLLGSSMGSFIATILAATYLKDIDGLVLSSTGTKLGGFNFFTKIVARFLALIIPKKKIEDPNIGGISRDLEVVKAYREDSLVSMKTTVKLAAELLRGNDKATQLIGQIGVPTLVQCGSADTTVFGREELDELMVMSDKTIKIYEGLFHEVYNELEEDRRTVLKDLGDWLDSHVSDKVRKGVES